MMKLPSLFLVTLFCLFSQSYAQVITGKVIDSETKESIQGAHVFINGNTGGAVSDSNGNYSFDTLGRSDFKLIVSHVSYDVKIYTFDSVEESFTLNMYLDPSINPLSDIEVTAEKNRRWERRLKQFKSIFLGKAYDPDLIEIENEYLLEFKDLETGGFGVEGQPVLKIQNRHLNYQVYFHLLDFDSRLSSFLGYSDFDEIKDSALDSLELNNRRREAYKGSLRHFFRAVIDDDLKNQGFSANVLSRKESATQTQPGLQNKILRTPLDVRRGLYDTGDLRVKILDNGYFGLEYEGSLEVIYNDKSRFRKPSQITTLTFKKSLVVDTNGVLLNPSSLQLNGHLLDEGVYYYLPSDYTDKD